jgi:hypothetical protein
MSLLDFVDFCRLEECPRSEIHPAHDRPYRRGDVHRGVFVIKSRDVILDSTLNAVGTRVLKAFGAIYHDVLSDYGSVKDRTVYRALARLIDARKVAVIVPHGSAKKLREGRLVRGGYIRWDSPLLMQRDGLQHLMEQADDLSFELGQGNLEGRAGKAPVRKRSFLLDTAGLQDLDDGAFDRWVS